MNQEETVKDNVIEPINQNNQNQELQPVQPVKSSSRKAIIISGGIFLILVLVLGVFLAISLLSPKPASNDNPNITVVPTTATPLTPTQTPTPIMTGTYKGWNTFQSGKLGISLNIPADWEVKEEVLKQLIDEDYYLDFYKNGKKLDVSLNAYGYGYGEFCGSNDMGIIEDTVAYKPQTFNLQINGKEEELTVCMHNGVATEATLKIENATINKGTGIGFGGAPKEDLETIKLILESITY